MLRRNLWRIAGLLALLLGAIGAVLPLLPTTPFVLLAAFCFARGEPAWHAWLLRHKVFGALIAEWEARGAVPRRAKWAATIMMAVSFGISVLLIHSRALWFAGISMALVLVWLWRRPE
ncbi:YbaN family protein [Jeongeupia naejangsanensis]|uniref:YbaN family protein n=1 Tax=Jeongeupia naejangsanensis TaxID=613195 RepID=A0ABS2BM81_9NEIS|nr:YbaN family protein [Jeongeupia naejangsanensis]MBM3116729.1 YbaN family protein [Jeongeupia naejangsanensis]